MCPAVNLRNAACTYLPLLDFRYQVGLHFKNRQLGAILTTAKLQNQSLLQTQDGATQTACQICYTQSTKLMNQVNTQTIVDQNFKSIRRMRVSEIFVANNYSGSVRNAISDSSTDGRG